MNHLVELRLNLKGEEFTLKGLEPRVFVYGDNGSGKTSIFNAVSLLHGEAAYDFAGKDSMKDAATLRTMADEDDLFVVGVWTDGTAADWKLAIPKGRPTSSKKVPAARFLFQEAESALIGARARDGAVQWLYDVFVRGDDLKSVAWPEATHDTSVGFAEIVKTLEDRTKLEKLPEVYKIAKARARAASAKSKELSTALSVLQEYRGTKKQELLTAMHFLLAFQADNNLTKCGTCGSGSVPEGRAEAVAGGLDKAGGSVGVFGSVVAEIADAASRHSTDADKWNAVAGYALNWMASVVKTVIPRIEDEVDALLPTGVSFGMHLDGSEFRFGYRQGERIYVATSGAETMLILAALCGAAAPYVSATGATPVIMMPDRKLSEKSLRLLLTMLSNVTASVWVQDLSPPRGRQKAGWSYVDTNEIRETTLLGAAG